MRVYKGFYYALRLTPEQKKICHESACASRFVWNKSLELKKKLWEDDKKKISWKGLDKLLPKWKRLFPWIKTAPSQSLQQVVKHLDRAFKSFFQGFGYPRFKSRYRDKSFKIVQGISLEGRLSKKVGLVKIPKLGLVRYTKTRNIEGEIKSATISMKGGKWQISFCCEVEINPKPKINGSKIGGDRGVAKTFQGSNGEILERLIPSVKDVKKLKKTQKNLARKQKGSSNWKKLVSLIQKIYIKFANQRKDAIHKLTSKLAKNHGLVVLEDLAIKNMTKSAKGTRASPGKNVKAKSGLNRVIL